MGDRSNSFCAVRKVIAQVRLIVQSLKFPVKGSRGGQDRPVFRLLPSQNAFKKLDYESNVQNDFRYEFSAAK